MENTDIQLDEKEFCDILTFLTNDDLSLFHKIARQPDPELEESRTEIQKLLRHTTFKNGQLYNAYCARVLVTDPGLHIQNEIVRRFLNGGTAP